jgi:hypothetical protein
MLGAFLLLVGVVLLFFFGMPYRTRTRGTSRLLLEAIDQKDLAQEKLYDFIGWIGLLLMIVGTGMQMYASWIEIPVRHAA